jgi:2-polyprenyl-3-methyl-5-hydroxy-6-metoxy-1,4-benzoquinol methylase
MTVKEHYDNHLSKYYSWMAGDFTEKQVEHQQYFTKHNLKPVINKRAFDLGCGHGIQTVTLASLGYNVKAIDFNTDLLTELSNIRGEFPIEIVNADILDFLAMEKSQAELIVCMGDTLTHFPSIDALKSLVQRVGEVLIPKGKFIVSFRDLTVELEGSARFIPVKSDRNRIFTCFLEYVADHVVVHDIIHEKEKNVWVQKVSAYPKLRISEKIINEIAMKNHLACISSETINRMIYLIFEKH